MSSSAPKEIPCDLPWKTQPAWGPASAGTISRFWRFQPEFVRGYTPILKRVSLRCKNPTAGTYDFANAPEWWVGFLDDADDRALFTTGTPRNMSEGSLPAAAAQPLASEPVFFELAGTFAVVNLRNGGKGFRFPKVFPTRYAPAMIYARTIGTAVSVQVTPFVVYRRNDLMGDD